MDNLTHGLLGLAVGATRRPEGTPLQVRRLSPTDRGVLFASFLAAELPDLDGLWPASNEVLGALTVHRGISHALIFTPVWAALATGLAKLAFREARLVPMLLHAWAAVVFAHLVADAWTGWGTRLFLPFSDARVTWDWTVVVDPLFTVPLLVAAVLAVIWRRRWRPVLLTGLAVALAYLGARIVVKQVLTARLEAIAAEVTVFPDWFGLTRWRYVARDGDAWVAGTVGLGLPVVEGARHPRSPALPPELEAIPTVQQAHAWARFPLWSVSPSTDGGKTVRIADLRYHLHGQPTLAMVVALDAAGKLRSAQLERPPNFRALIESWRRGPEGAEE